MAVVLSLARRVDAHRHRELLLIGAHLQLTRQLGDALDRERLVARQPQRSDRVPGLELQRQHAHPHQVGAVDALEALRDHGAHAEQLRALRRPVARGAGAVLLAGEHDQRHLFLLVAHRGVVDRQLLDRPLLDGSPPAGPPPRPCEPRRGPRQVVGEPPSGSAAPSGARSRLRMRMLAKVPRIITSWLPRRAPKELKSRGATPCSCR